MQALPVVNLAELEGTALKPPAKSRNSRRVASRLAPPLQPKLLVSSALAQSCSNRCVECSRQNPPRGPEGFCHGLLALTSCWRRFRLLSVSAVDGPHLARSATDIAARQGPIWPGALQVEYKGVAASGQRPSAARAGDSESAFARPHDSRQFRGRQGRAAALDAPQRGRQQPVQRFIANQQPVHWLPLRSLRGTPPRYGRPQKFIAP